MEKSQMYAEALLRMRSLQDKFNLNPMILQYLEEDMLLFSWHDLGVAAGCDMIDNDECYEEAVKEFEEKTGNFVYHVIEKKMWADAGEYQISSLENDVDEPVIMLTFLYVSHDAESWKEQRLNGDHLLAFV
ncbi:MAG: hypothetical protein K6E13_08945, partial [Lachnospiraceae bacterium]|nr:hypothetical protein [Lachnospiraceae bacterium]